MKRTYALSDWFCRLSHAVRRNRFPVLAYAVLCLLFLTVGIAVGVGLSNKSAFVLRNTAPIFQFLRGDIGIFALFFRDFFPSAVYCVFAASMFFYRALAFISVAPSAYRAYVLGMNVGVIIAVFSVSAIPLLFVAYIPVCLIEIAVLCTLSFKCFVFSSLNCGCFPSKTDVREYYKDVARFIFAIAMLSAVKTVMLSLFGSALIGII